MEFMNWKMALGMAVYTCNPSAWEAGVGDPEIKVSLGYIVRFCWKQTNDGDWRLKAKFDS